MSLLQIAQNIATFITGQGGILLIIIAIAGAGIRTAFSGGHHWGGVWAAVGGGAFVFAAAWIVQTFLGGGGGTGI